MDRMRRLVGTPMVHKRVPYGCFYVSMSGTDHVVLIQASTFHNSIDYLHTMHNAVFHHSQAYLDDDPSRIRMTFQASLIRCKP